MAATGSFHSSNSLALGSGPCIAVLWRVSARGERAAGRERRLEREQQRKRGAIRPLIGGEIVCVFYFDTEMTGDAQFVKPPAHYFSRTPKRKSWLLFSRIFIMPTL
jgi:hypothetical protein